MKPLLPHRRQPRASASGTDPVASGVAGVLSGDGCAQGYRSRASHVGVGQAGNGRRAVRACDTAGDDVMGREQPAGERLMCLLPLDQVERFDPLGREFQSQGTVEARFARA